MAQKNVPPFLRQDEDDERFVKLDTVRVIWDTLCFEAQKRKRDHLLTEDEVLALFNRAYDLALLQRQMEEGEAWQPLPT